MLGVKKILTQEEKAYFFCWLVFFQVASSIWCNLGLLLSASPIFCCTLLLFTLRYFLSTSLYSLYLSITLYILFLKKIYPFSSRNIFLELHIHITRNVSLKLWLIVSKIYLCNRYTFFNKGWFFHNWVSSFLTCWKNCFLIRIFL